LGQKVPGEANPRAKATNPSASDEVFEVRDFRVIPNHLGKRPCDDLLEARLAVESVLEFNLDCRSNKIICFSDSRDAG